MRKIIVIITIGVLVSTLFVSSGFAAPVISRVPGNTLYISQNTLPPITPEPTPTPVEYQLPYPGLLPDNMLYKLKTLRDRIISFLISEPLKKADFDILQADKRYNAGLFLFQERNPSESLIIDTVSKADNYMEEAVGQLDLAKKQGENNKDLLHKMLLSNQKHLEVLSQIEKTASASLKQYIDREEKRIGQIEKEVTVDLSR